MIERSTATWNLYLVQDSDRPMYVFARSWNEAHERWIEAVALENDISTEEIDDPTGIQLVADSHDVVMPPAVDAGESETPGWCPDCGGTFEWTALEGDYGVSICTRCNLYRYDNGDIDVSEQVDKRMDRAPQSGEEVE